MPQQIKLKWAPPWLLRYHAELPLGPFSPRFAEGYNADGILEAGCLEANTCAFELQKCPVKDGLCSEVD